MDLVYTGLVIALFALTCAIIYTMCNFHRSKLFLGFVLAIMMIVFAGVGYETSQYRAQKYPTTLEN